MIKLEKFFPDNYLEYVDNFNRKGYGPGFDRYSSECEKVMTEYDAQSGDLVAQELVNIMLTKAKGLWKKRKSLDIQYFLMLYLTPVLLKQKDESLKELARKIRDEWVRRSGENSYDLMTFDDISSGFTDTVMGFRLDFGGKK